MVRMEQAKHPLVDTVSKTNEDQCFICLNPKTRTIYLGGSEAEDLQPADVQWLACGHWIHKLCHAEYQKHFGIKDAGDLRCGICKKTGNECNHEAGMKMDIPAGQPQSR